MPWKEHDAMEERFRFIEDWRSEDWTMAELCRFYGVTRGTGYKWLGRYEAEGLEGLREWSRAPRHHPNEISNEVQEAVIGLRAQHPSWGAPKIRARLERDQADLGLPAESTIGAILKRNGLTVPRPRRPHSRPSSEPLAHASASNQVWSADFKGWFRTQDGMRIDPLTISDNYSRYLFRCQSVAAADTAHSKPVFEAAFREFGLPCRIRTDNGAPFGSNGERTDGAFGVVDQARHYARAHRRGQTSTERAPRAHASHAQTGNRVAAGRQPAPPAGTLRSLPARLQPRAPASSARTKHSGELL